MTDLAVLYLLAVVDGLFVGYRDANGRNPRLDKRRYYRRAMLRGIALVHLAVVIIMATVGTTLWWATDYAVAVEAFEDAAAVLRAIYLGYTICVAVALGIYLLPSYEVRAYITITALGLLTLLRPVVIAGGAVVAAVSVSDPVVWPTCLAVAVTMSGLQPLLYLLGWNRVEASPYITRDRVSTD